MEFKEAIKIHEACEASALGMNLDCEHCPINDKHYYADNCICALLSEARKRVAKVQSEGDRVLAYEKSSKDRENYQIWKEERLRV